MPNNLVSKQEYLKQLKQASTETEGQYDAPTVVERSRRIAHVQTEVLIDILMTLRRIERKLGNNHAGQ